MAIDLENKFFSHLSQRRIRSSSHSLRVGIITHFQSCLRAVLTFQASVIIVWRHMDHLDFLQNITLAHSVGASPANWTKRTKKGMYIQKPDETCTLQKGWDKSHEEIGAGHISEDFRFLWSAVGHISVPKYRRDPTSYTSQLQKGSRMFGRSLWVLKAAH